MSDEAQQLEAEKKYKQWVWRNMVAGSAAALQAIGWSITAVAAIAALLIDKLDTIGNAVSLTGLKWGLVFFAFSLLFGALCKFLGWAVINSLEAMAKAEAFSKSADGQEIWKDLPRDRNRLMIEVAEPFWWPLSSYYRAAVVKAMADPLSNEKRLIKMNCLQVFSSAFHILFATLAIIIVGFSIKS